ncbi:hypothetical protein K491DRAFT_719638 [Lophiostoma macrostomum CBS 122681]|uniref:Uncharacterized protein n=1 Tax=Lophiostoma macrostomum CBS 122681 TaxID=1314788 RepID=A0A6A6SVP6_9PLEO|nr:hypothetical protein K491DRAFT_719638 [Lophiostoma macrostomum CBS 122681]
MALSDAEYEAELKKHSSCPNPAKLSWEQHHGPGGSGVRLLIGLTGGGSQLHAYANMEDSGAPCCRIIDGDGNIVGQDALKQCVLWEPFNTVNSKGTGTTYQRQKMSAFLRWCFFLKGVIPIFQKGEGKTTWETLERVLDALAKKGGIQYPLPVLKRGFSDDEDIDNATPLYTKADPAAKKAHIVRKKVQSAGKEIQSEKSRTAYDLFHPFPAHAYQVNRLKPQDSMKVVRLESRNKTLEKEAEDLKGRLKFRSTMTMVGKNKAEKKCDELTEKVKELEQQNGTLREKVKMLGTGSSAKRNELLEKRVKDLERENVTLKTKVHELKGENSQSSKKADSVGDVDEEHARGFKMVYRLLMNECGRSQDPAQAHVDQRRMRVTVNLALNGRLKELLDDQGGAL